MRRILHLIMIAIATFGLVVFFTMPFYQFDDEQIKENGLEIYSGTYVRRNSDFRNLNAVEQKAYKEAYVKANTIAYAFVHHDAEMLYIEMRHEILVKINDDYALGFDTTCETERDVDMLEARIETAMGADFEPARLAELESVLNDPANGLDEDITNKAIGSISDQLFLEFNEYPTDNELIDMTIEEHHLKGYKIKDLINAYKHVIQSYKTIAQKDDYVGLSFINKVKAISKDENFYNPLPLLGLSVIMLWLLLTLVHTLLRGIRGIIGKKSVSIVTLAIGGALCLALMIFSAKIPTSFYLDYHGVEFARLLNLFTYGNYSTSVIVCLGVFAIAIILRILCIFFPKFSRKDK